MTVTRRRFFVFIAPFEDLALGTNLRRLDARQEILSLLQVLVGIIDSQDVRRLDDCTKNVVHELIVHGYVDVHWLRATSHAEVARDDKSVLW